MVFASGMFLFLFLPITFTGYCLLRNRAVVWRNFFLLGMSIVFYLRSGLKELLLLFLSIAVNYMFARMIAGSREKSRKLYLILAVVYNIGMLFVFKYMTFIAGQAYSFGSLPDSVWNIALPLGISFYTFQALSYVIDVYRKPEIVEKNLIHVALYISFFPQLVAGPIVRWETIRKELKIRVGGGINSGLERFAIGLGKKVIIANQMAVYADKAFELLASKELTTAFSWMGAVAYTLQIYYDFSGYSDMAIGLGEIFGFHFPENFNYPYISKSITEFWRRWHISLSSWFKDYVYIPLGGSRCSTRRMFFNLFIVWLCTGVWHGANYTFWLWGIVYFAVLAAEKLMTKSRPEKFKALSDTAAVSVFKHVYTLLMVIFLWVLFRADSLRDAGLYMLHMLGNGADTGYAVGVTKLYLKNGIGYFIIAMIGCIPWTAVLKRRINLSEHSWNRISQLCVILIFAIACCVTIDSNYNPFIYFNF